MERISKSDITAILALVGISSGGFAISQPAHAGTAKNQTNPMFVAENKAPAGKGKDSACGKGSCGTDDKGAAAAKKAHSKKASGKSSAKSTKKSDTNTDKASDNSGSAK
jgi:uncharacterized low-complexity protein